MGTFNEMLHLPKCCIDDLSYLTKCCIIKDGFQRDVIGVSLLI